jgi:hypothetical protein
MKERKAIGNRRRREKTSVMKQNRGPTSETGKCQTEGERQTYSNAPTTVSGLRSSTLDRKNDPGINSDDQQ